MASGLAADLRGAAGPMAQTSRAQFDQFVRAIEARLVLLEEDTGEAVGFMFEFHIYV